MSTNDGSRGHSKPSKIRQTFIPQFLPCLVFKVIFRQKNTFKKNIIFFQNALSAKGVRTATTEFKYPGLILTGRGGSHGQKTKMAYFGFAPFFFNKSMTIMLFN